METTTSGFSNQNKIIDKVLQNDKAQVQTDRIQQTENQEQYTEKHQQIQQRQSTDKLSSFQRRQSKQKMTFVYKPPRVNKEQQCEVIYKIKDIQKSTAAQEVKEDIEQENNSPLKSANKITVTQESSIEPFQKNDLKSDIPILNQNPSTLLDPNNANNNHGNFLRLNKQKKTHIIKSSNNLISESFRRISMNPILQDDDQQFNQSFLNDTPHANNNNKSSFDQFAEENTSIVPFQPKKLEIKANFVSHSTDFAFITQLLELKSKAADNLKIYNENKSIQQMRQILSDERILKQTILNLSKSTFGAFYDCLHHTLESSDLFFHLTNKLKNMVNAIIKIHLQHEITDAFQIIIKETCKVLECDRASVFLVNASTQELWTKIAKGSGVIKVPFGQGLVGFVANTMKPLNILDAHKDSRFNPEIDKKNNYHTKSVLCVPVIDQDKGNLVGVMQAINKNDGFFTKDDEGCLQIMAMHAMNVLRNSISHDEKQKNQSMIKNLLNISIKLNKCLNIEDLIVKGRDMICTYLEISDFRLYLIDQKSHHIFTLNEFEQRIEFEQNCGLIGYAIQQKQDEMIDNAYNHTTFNQLVDINTSMPLSMYLIWDNPRKKNQIYGVVQVINSNGIHNIGQSTKGRVKFDSHLKLFCEIVGSQVKKFYKNNTPIQNQQHGYQLLINNENEQQQYQQE